MKKIFIGLLIIAAGASIFFLLQKKDEPHSDTSIQKEQIVATWKITSMQPGKDTINWLALMFFSKLDSNILKTQYQFTKEGNVLLSSPDSINAGNGQWEWNSKNQLVLKENSKDTTAEILDVALLNKDTLQLVSTDSAQILFTRVK